MTLPLDGLVVLDLTHVLAGPFSSLHLAQFGARVIKVERPGCGDDTREFPPFKEGESGYFACINHSKESIALDLKAEEDRKIFNALLERADVVLENYRPGVMEKLGYGWEALHARFPRLIYGAVSGFGHTGPEAGKPAYDMVVQARGGVMSITGEEGREPVRVGASIGDIIAGLYLTQGILGAVIARQSTGRGQKVDVAMFDSQIAILEHAFALTTVTGASPRPTGARHPTITPFETFHAQDGLFVIAAGNDTLFKRLCATLDVPELGSDPRFATNAARCENHVALKQAIEAVTRGAGKAEWIARLEAAGVPTAPIQSMAEALADPQLLARNMVIPLTAPDGRPGFKAPGNPVKMSELPELREMPAAPKLDGDRAEILRWLGL